MHMYEGTNDMVNIISTLNHEITYRSNNIVRLAIFQVVNFSAMCKSISKIIYNYNKLI